MHKNKINLALCAITTLVLGACGDSAAFEDPPGPAMVDASPPSASEPELRNEDKPISFDVAEDLTRFVSDDAPLDEDGLPKHGASFVTQGYLYPFLFLYGRDGVNPDGSPAYPDHVIGTWASRGHFIGDGAAADEGHYVVSTQIYDFFERPGYHEGKISGSHTVVSEGYESAELGVLVSRAIIGGSGKASDVGGEALQMLIGFNGSGGVNLAVYGPVGFNPIIHPEDLPDAPPRDARPPCELDIFRGFTCGDEWRLFD